MIDPDDIDQINPDDVTLTEAILGYNIVIDGEPVGAIEGLPGSIEYLTVEPHWENRGVARAALIMFVEMSRVEGCTEVRTNNVTHPAMEHVLETEGFETRPDDIDWVKQL